MNRIPGFFERDNDLCSRRMLLAALVAFMCASATIAGDAPSKDDYKVTVLPENIAPTAPTQARAKIEVFGEPRIVKGHPCTLVDSDDIEAYKKALKSNAVVQADFARLKGVCDKRITQPLDVPVAQKASDGSWMYPGDFSVNVSPLNGNNPDPSAPGFKRVSHTNESNCCVMANLGMAYQLTGDEKYGEFCKKMLLAYADGYNNYGHPSGWTRTKYRSAFDGRLTGQFLEDGGWLNATAYAYDLVYNLPSWTAKERAHVRDDLFKPVAAEFIDPAVGKPDYLSSENNRSALCAAGVLIAGYATEDQELINDALYGGGGTKEAPAGGMLQVHFGDKCLLPDGLWVEGAPGYQLGIASCGLFNAAETLWRHGIDMYRFRDGALKRLLDSALVLAYPDAKMGVAALHDSGPFSVLDSRGWLNNEIGVPYECGYRRYRDPHYLPVVRNAAKSLSMTVHQGGPSLFLELPDESAPLRTVENANFYSVGYGVLRQATPNGANQLILEYGASAGHAHPSKLGIDLYALGGVTMPFPGVIYPYNDPRDPNWYSTTFSNCDMVVDNMSQLYGGNNYLFERGSPKPVAEQLVYGPASTMGIERAGSNSIYGKVNKDAVARVMGVDQPPPPFTRVTQDRALFLTPEYMADIFGAFSTAPHQYDLVWHIRGQMTTTLKAEPFKFPAPVPVGYNTVTNLTHASSDQAWTASIVTPEKQTLRLLAAGGNATDVYLGNGIFFAETPPVILQRRSAQNNVLFGNVVDISGDKDGFLKGVTQTGSLDAGYGLLQIKTAKGVDLCFSSFRPGSYSAGGLQTDALQALVRMDGENIQALYLGGGLALKVGGGAIQRSAPGLAYVERVADGGYIVCNPSPSDATVTVRLPALSGLKAYALDDHGQRGAPAAVTKQGDAIAIVLAAKAQVEFCGN